MKQETMSTPHSMKLVNIAQKKGEKMMNTNDKTNPNKTARIAGFLYLLLIPLGVFGMLYVPATLLCPKMLQQ